MHQTQRRSCVFNGAKRVALTVLLNVLLVPLANAVVVLQYHHVSTTTPAATSIDPQRFQAHLEYLHEAKFDVVSILTLESWLREGKRLPDKTVVITFDDGYTSVYDAAFPLLKKYGWPFTVFVNSKAHDEKHPHFMSWEQLRELAKQGAVIANHTDSHPHLIRQQGYESHSQWLQRREREIEFAQQRIAKELGQAPKLFAYPFGEYDKQLQATLKSMGYLAFGQQSGPLADTSHPQALPRFPFGGNYTEMEEFKVKVNSLPFPQARVKVSGNDGKVIEQPELPKDIARPVLRIASPLLSHLGPVSCFASGQGAIQADVKGGALVAKAKRDLPPGRSRYNCTASAGGGRFYWHSQMFIRRLPNGEWVNE